MQLQLYILLYYCMLVDLQHSLTNSYASIPELRKAWLELRKVELRKVWLKSMAKINKKYSSYSEVRTIAVSVIVICW